MFEISSKVTIKTPEWVSDVFQVSLLLILLWFLHFDFDQVTDQVSFIMIFYMAVIWKYSKILKKKHRIFKNTPYMEFSKKLLLVNAFFISQFSVFCFDWDVSKSHKKIK